MPDHIPSIDSFTARDQSRHQGGASDRVGRKTAGVVGESRSHLGELGLNPRSRNLRRTICPPVPKDRTGHREERSPPSSVGWDKGPCPIKHARHGGSSIKGWQRHTSSYRFQYLGSAVDKVLHLLLGWILRPVMITKVADVCEVLIEPPRRHIYHAGIAQSVVEDSKSWF